MRVRIRIEGNARGRTLRFVFGPRRRRRLTARVIPLGSLAELSALWRRVFCSVAGLTGEAASWDTQLPTPSTLLSEEGTCLRSFVDPDFALRLPKKEGNLDSSSSLPSLTFASPQRGEGFPSWAKEGWGVVVGVRNLETQVKVFL